ncbi:MAG: GNAT family N-acetyltransferase [Lewinellaceae bacterium]|nr:GNAT family N-acetyltransferase [Saprospiraceae bacterium]MCB9332085.1 GNAT family N-acetyltransferase [Lewinellaceae bacterium]
MATFSWLPLTQDSWTAFTTLFGPKGACGGCWCMLWRLPRQQYDAGKGDSNRNAMQELVESGTQPGIIGLLDGAPAAWCSVGPRPDFPGLERSRILKPVDDRPVWSITCLFIDKKYRRQGMSGQMIAAAADFARSHGARILEAYPVEPKQENMPAVFAWTGIAAAFLQAGFQEVARRSETRPVLRLEL